MTIPGGLINRCDKILPALSSICTECVFKSHTRMCDNASVQIPRGCSSDLREFPLYINLLFPFWSVTNTAPDLSWWELSADITTSPLLFSVMNFGVLEKHRFSLLGYVFVKSKYFAYSFLKSVSVGHFGWGKHSRDRHSE